MLANRWQSVVWPSYRFCLRRSSIVMVTHSHSADRMTCFRKGPGGQQKQKAAKVNGSQSRPLDALLRELPDADGVNDVDGYELAAIKADPTSYNDVVTD
jgi:hypothetical protein